MANTRRRLMRILRLFLLLGTLLVLAQILAVLARLSSSHGPPTIGGINLDDNLNHLASSVSAADNATRWPIIKAGVELHLVSSNNTESTRSSILNGASSNWQPPPPTLGSLCSVNHNDSDSFIISQHFPHAPSPWIQCYVSWHREMRRRFPGQQLLTHPQAPGILIRYCDRRAHHGLCGGLHDRLGNLASWIYLANQTQRILLYKWFHPLPLESFLQPNLVDWTVPSITSSNNDSDIDPFDHQHIRHHRSIMYQWKKHRKSYHDDIALRLKTEDTFRNERILVANADATVPKLAESLRALGEVDLIDDSDTFGQVFRALFRPSHPLQVKINETMHSLGLQPGQYVAAHARVRHPARYSTYIWRLAGKDNTTDADESGLPWNHPSRERDAAIASAIHAIQCSRLLLLQQGEKNIDNNHNNNVPTVYFYSDSEDLVRFVTNQTVSDNNSIDEESSDINSNSNSTSLSLETWRQKAATALSSFHSRGGGGGGGEQGGQRVVSRRVGNRPTAHLDRGERQNAKLGDYLDTFLDLYIAIYARCISYGYGNYAYFAAKISGTKCLQRHEQPEASVGKMWNQQSHGDKCPIPPIKY